MAQVVLYDACVLYPAPLRDLLMRLTLTDLFQARWTDQIHDEWTRGMSRPVALISRSRAWPDVGSSWMSTAPSPT